MVCMRHKSTQVQELNVVTSRGERDASHRASTAGIGNVRLVAASLNKRSTVRVQHVKHRMNATQQRAQAKHEFMGASAMCNKGAARRVAEGQSSQFRKGCSVRMQRTIHRVQRKGARK
eukprot:5643857-Pleurochrysis_carterae.AAC.2